MSCCQIGTKPSAITNRHQAISNHHADLNVTIINWHLISKWMTWLNDMMGYTDGSLNIVNQITHPLRSFKLHLFYFIFYFKLRAFYHVYAMCEDTTWTMWWDSPDSRPQLSLKQTCIRDISHLLKQSKHWVRPQPGYNTDFFFLNFIENDFTHGQTLTRT